MTGISVNCLSVTGADTGFSEGGGGGGEGQGGPLKEGG